MGCVGATRWRLAGAAPVALGLGLLLGSGAAQAQVIEIRPDGVTVTYAGPGIFSESGLQPITAKAGPSPAANPISEVLKSAAARNGISAKLVEAVAWQESRFRPESLSPRGAQGPMQLMPATARELGVDITDPEQNVEGGAAYLAAMLTRFGGDLSLALAAYNAGPQAVARHGGVPPFPETRAYVAAVLERLAAASGASAQTGNP